MTEKLKPCPFCNGEAELLEQTSRYSVRCKKCECMLANWSIYKIEAITRWNTRYEPPKKFKVGDTFYYVDNNGFINIDTFEGFSMELALIYMGNIFSTKTEAEEHKDEIMKKYEEISDRWSEI